MKDKRNPHGCPRCGGQLVIDVLYQHTRRYKILKNGRRSERYSIHEIGPEEAEILWCMDCEANFEDFRITADGNIEIYLEEGE